MSTSESGESAGSTGSVQEDKKFVSKVLGEMKSQFNKTDNPAEEQPHEEDVTTNTTTTTETDPKSSPVTPVSGEESEAKPPSEGTNELQPEEDSEKPRIVLTLFKKPITDGKSKDLSSSRRSLRNKSSEDKIDESNLKRSARRRSKDYSESVLQNAIARKEKSYNESSKPQRLTRQLKPTQKILENLALAKQSKTTRPARQGSEKIDRPKYNDSDSSYVECEDDGRSHSRKHKHKHHRHNKRYSKRPRIDNGKDSDSEQEDGKEARYRRSRRLSSSRSRDDLIFENDADEPILSDNSTIAMNDSLSYASSNIQFSSVGAQLIASRLCLCTQKTEYYLDLNSEDATYCSAVDSVSEKNVGCTKIISKDAMMLRASTRVPYGVLCETHKNRLLRHNCCPSCGIFCTQGRFVECENKHQYHRDCQISVGNVQCCPHCGLSTPDYDVNITMHSTKKPVFLPTQKAQYVSARMSFQSSFKTDEELKCVTPPLLPIGTLELLSSPQCRNEVYDVSDVVTAIKNNATEKVAAMLGSKIDDICTKIPDCNEGTLMHLAAQSGHVSIVHMLLAVGLQADVFDKDQNTPLMLAILSEKNDVVQYLIRIGVSIGLKGTDGMTALHLAAKCGNIKACELLLKVSSGIKNYVNSLDDGGWTPLVWACEHGYADVANFLIHKGADPSLRDVEHNVALHWAAFSGSSHIAELLLSKGCDVNAVNAHGDTPLHIGARQDMYNCIVVLLARGANVTLLNKNNESPLDCVPQDGDCCAPLSLNISLQSSIEYECQDVILTNDISKGREINPIQCYNNVDHDPKPTDFLYVTKNCITSDDVRVDTRISSLQSCHCEERCVDDDCLCGKLSLRCWYDEDGKLISDFSYSDIPMIFECNDACSCNAITCNNRVVQKGLTQRFELFKTQDKGWGIRTLRLIPKGSFVCEYVGEIVTDSEADKRDDDSYLFDLENRVCKSISDSDGFSIDAKFYGNFARFINHSCCPNLTPIKVFIDHQDLRFPRIAFFATKDIHRDEELSFDYGEKFWIAKYKSFYCSCGSLECKYSEDTIENTVQSYQRRLLEDCG